MQNQKNHSHDNEEHLSVEALDDALEQIELHGDNSFFSLPFEYEGIRNQWHKWVRAYLANQEMSRWQTRGCRKFSIPKHGHTYEQAIQLDPLDTVVFNGLMHEIGVQCTYHNAVGQIAFLEQSIRKAQWMDISSGHAYVVSVQVADLMTWMDLDLLKQILSERFSKPFQVKQAIRFLKSWQHETLCALPAGNVYSHTLLEIFMDVVDQLLIEADVLYVRCESEYRLFCNSEVEAYATLEAFSKEILAQYGLTFYHYATRVLTAKAYVMAATSRKALLEKAEEPMVTAQELIGMLKEQAAKTTIDEMLVSVCLCKLTQMKHRGALDLCITTIDKFTPVIKCVFEYIRSLDMLTADEKKAYGEFFIDVLNDTAIGQLPYFKMCLFELFKSDPGWVDMDVSTAPIEWEHLRDLKLWERRALIYSATCKERMKAIQLLRDHNAEFDVLDKVIYEWMKERLY